MLRGDLGSLKFCLVGSWKTQRDPSPSLQELEALAKMAWRLKENVLFAFLNHDLMLLEFDSSDEAKWVLENGRRSFREISRNWNGGIQ